MKHSRAEIDFVNQAVQRAEPSPPRMERRTMFWAVQRVQQILESADSLAGCTHADAAAAMYEIGVCQERVRQLLAGDRRPAQ